jgi:hypothetical protein
VNAAIRVSSGVVAEDRGADAINADNPIGANAVDALATPTLVPESLCLSSPGDASLAAVLTEGAASADHRTAAPDAAQLVLQTLRGVVNRIGACASNGFIDEWELQSCVGERKERARMTQTLIREGYLSEPISDRSGLLRYRVLANIVVLPPDAYDWVACDWTGERLARAKSQPSEKELLAGIAAKHVAGAHSGRQQASVVELGEEAMTILRRLKTPSVSVDAVTAALTAVGASRSWMRTEILRVLLTTGKLLLIPASVEHRAMYAVIAPQPVEERRRTTEPPSPNIPPIAFPSAEHAELRKNAVRSLLASGSVQGKDVEAVRCALPSALEAITHRLMTLHDVDGLRTIASHALAVELRGVGVKTVTLREHLVNLLVWTKVIAFLSKGSNGEVTYALLPGASAEGCKPRDAANHVCDDKSFTIIRTLTALLRAQNRTTIQSNELSLMLKSSGVKLGRQKGFVEYFVANRVLTIVGPPLHGIRTYELSALRTASDNDNAATEIPVAAAGAGNDPIGAAVISSS